jgi:UDP-GlcNAc:undecaprenyl-phosphate GlcNAc-1-phosphate transferase
VNLLILESLGLFLAGGLLVGLLTPKIRSFAIRKKIFDAPNSAHKTHFEPVPYLGGLAIIAGVLMVSLVSTYLTNAELIGTMLGILVPPLFLAAIGLVDDILNLSPWPRFLAQTLVGIAVALVLILSETFGSPTGSRIFDAVITVLFIVGLSNSINFFDNVDGGASGAVAISSFFLALITILTSQFYIATLSLVLAGATLGFLWWNKSPARIYMGDAGSLFLGSLLASLLVRLDTSPVVQPMSFFIPLFLVAAPLLDTCTAVTSRFVRKVSPFKGGRDHLSHRLMRVGIKKVHAVFILWTLTTFFCLLSFFISMSSPIYDSYFVMTGTITWLLSLAFFLYLPSSDSKN